MSALTKVAGGSHSFFSTPSEVITWEEPYLPSEVPELEVTFDGGIALLSIPAFSSGRENDIGQYLESAARVFDSERARSACGWILDLRSNTGGDMRAMLVAVSPLLDNGTVMTFQNRDGTSSNVVVSGTSVSWGDSDWGSLPDRAPKLEGRPIALLQSASTASAAEGIILAFTGQESTATYGFSTAGYTTVNGGFDLSDGSVVTLSFALMGDRNQNFHEGSIEPNFAVGKSQIPPLESARNSITNQCDRSRS
ncbi:MULTISPECIES: S41 family peptidase [unclassified Leucobacter]|uniref:S41 family peptidase n=1 Tax=unclassified Leucobacter TaxID=2621730 RepID=UPI00165DC3DC|nr:MULTISPECIES: S41 family peptidase [unclassified Leucobacter]MBC9935335.1 S41 family peptidase [Leucobacter sp. cx-87]